MRGVALGAVAALLAASLARPAPVPPAAKGTDTPEGRFVLQLSLPPLGLFDAKKVKLKEPVVGKDDMRLYPEQAGEKAKPPFALRDAHLLLWATSPARPPKALAKDVEALRKKRKHSPSALIARVSAAEEARRPALNRRLKDASTQIARAYADIETAADLMQQINMTDEARRFQAWHTYLTAALLTRAIYLDEHQAALGRMRKEAPPLGAGHKAWELRATDRLSDAQARRKYKEAAKFWQQLAKDQPNTVWEALARDALKVPLGAEWVSVP